MDEETKAACRFRAEGLLSHFPDAERVKVLTMMPEARELMLSLLGTAYDRDPLFNSAMRYVVDRTCTLEEALVLALDFTMKANANLTENMMRMIQQSTSPPFTKGVYP